MTIKEWMTATWISSKEFCGIDLSHIEQSMQLNFNDRKQIQWANITKPCIVCNDGFSMSVQGGFGVYSTPKKPVEQFEDMEVGFPSQPDSLLNTSQEDPIAGYTSIETLQIIVDKHGGINVGKTLEGLTNKNVQKWKRNLKLKRILNEE